jgi:hypothetical protein
MPRSRQIGSGATPAVIKRANEKFPIWVNQALTEAIRFIIQFALFASQLISKTQGIHLRFSFFPSKYACSMCSQHLLKVRRPFPTDRPS